jgi:hypothetical protein
MVSRLVCEWSAVTRSTARNANAKSVSLLRSKADRIACERTSSRNRNTVAASVRLCAGGRFWAEKVLRHLNGVDNYVIGAHREKNSQITVAFQSW